MRNVEMFKTTRRAGVLLLGLFLSACHFGKHTEEITNYQITKTLRVDESRLIKNSCFGSSFIVDDFVVFIADCDSMYFHVFDKHTLDFKFKFGPQGRGPAEFQLPLPLPTNTTKLPKDGYYFFYEPNLFQVKKINFNRIFEGHFDEAAISSSFVERRMYATMNWNQLYDNRIAATHITDTGGLFFIYNTDNEKKNWVKYVHSFDMDDDFKLSVFSGNLISNGEIIIFASVYLDEILVFDNQGKLLKKYHFSPIQMPKLSSQSMWVALDSPQFFNYSYGNTNACYLTRAATSPEEHLLNPYTELFEMSWNGELLHVHEMDFIPYGFSICEKEDYLYGVLATELENDSITLIKSSLK